MKKVKQGKNGYWYKITQFESCCDCGLCHEREYKIIMNGKIPKTMYVRFWRDEEKTIKNRKDRKLKILTL